MNIEYIQGIIVEFQKKDIPSLTPRNLSLRIIPEVATGIVGSRRCGKTYRTYQFVSDLYEKGVPRENICRIQFNDIRLKGLEGEELLLIDQAYYTLFPAKRHKEEVYFIFDEIQRIDGWEDYVLGLLDNHNHRVLITGSTSKMLSGEFASALRGKLLPQVLYPYSFKEFLSHHTILIDPVSFSGVSHLQNGINRYLTEGGFPGITNFGSEERIEVLQTYWQTMLLRDVIEAHRKDKINFDAFSFFTQSLISRTSCPLSITKISQHMKEIGFRFSVETIYKYLRYLKEAFIIYTIPIYTQSEKVRNRNYKKVYTVDWALANAVAFAGSIDITRQFENCIFIELVRRKHSICYYKTRKGYEIDFIAVTSNKRENSKNLYQVCYDLGSKEVLKRATRGIAETMRYLNLDNAFIITMNNKD
ncbi:MAG: ATP-binding protein [bacterium]